MSCMQECIQPAMADVLWASLLFQLSGGSSKVISLVIMEIFNAFNLSLLNFIEFKNLRHWPCFSGDLLFVQTAFAWINFCNNVDLSAVPR